jgi:hypothetical protein
MAAPEGASAALPHPKIDTFWARFQDRANDPYGGGYQAALAYFDQNEPVQEAQALYHLFVVSAPMMGILVGIFEDPNHEEVRSLGLHGINIFEAVIGCPTEWDRRAFAFANDVVGGMAQSVEIPPEMFSRTRHNVSTQIHNTIANVKQAWASHPNDHLVANTEPGLESAMTIFLMLAPPRYAPIIINHRLSPTQLWDELGGAIIVNGNQGKYAPLLTWMVLAATHPVATSPSTLIVPCPAPPLGDFPSSTIEESCYISSFPTWIQPGSLGIPAPPE